MAENVFQRNFFGAAKILIQPPLLQKILPLQNPYQRITTPVDIETVIVCFSTGVFCCFANFVLLVLQL